MNALTESCPSKPGPSVAHVLWSGGVGGIERLVTDLAFSQIDDGRGVGVLYGRPSGYFYDLCIKRPGLEVAVAGFSSGADLSPTRAKRAADFLTRFEIVHVHAYSPPLTFSVDKSRLPVVCTLHGSFRRAGWHRRMLLARMRRRFLESAGAVTANSDFCREWNARTLNIASSRIRVVHNAVVRPPRSGQPTQAVVELRDAGAGLVAGVVSRLVSWKRVERAVRAVAETPEEDSVALVVAGDGPEMGNLKDLVNSLHLSDRVSFLGSIANIGDFLADIDVLVHPSEGEPFGLVLGEAALCGTPVIGFRDGGGGVEVIRWVNGVVVADVPALTQILSQLSREGIPEEMRPDISTLEERFSVQTMKNHFDDIYREVLAHARQR